MKLLQTLFLFGFTLLAIDCLRCFVGYSDEKAGTAKYNMSCDSNIRFCLKLQDTTELYLSANCDDVDLCKVPGPIDLANLTITCCQSDLCNNF